MPCDTNKRISIKVIDSSLKKLRELLRTGKVQVVVDTRTGAVAFNGWTTADRGGLQDACAYRRLMVQGDFTLAQAVARAEALAGRQVSNLAVAGGIHSHDGGQTWGAH